MNNNVRVIENIFIRDFLQWAPKQHKQQRLRVSEFGAGCSEKRRERRRSSLVSTHKLYQILRCGHREGTGGEDELKGRTQNVSTLLESDYY